MIPTSAGRQGKGHDLQVLEEASANRRPRLLHTRLRSCPSCDSVSLSVRLGILPPLPNSNIH
jgi:hypothetical protein